MLLRRFHDPVQQVLGFCQFRGEAEEGCPPFSVAQLNSGFKQSLDFMLIDNTTNAVIEKNQDRVSMDGRMMLG